MGSAIHVESDPGEGSVFQFCLTLPLAAAGGLAPGQPDFGGRLALVAEPHMVSRRSLVKLLRQWNFTVEEARDGREAMAALVRQRRQHRAYHLVLLASILSLAAVVSRRSWIYCLSSCSMKRKASASLPTSSRYFRAMGSMELGSASVELKS